MTAIDRLFDDQGEDTTAVYLTLSDVTAHTGPYGRYLRLHCLDTEGLPVDAIADERYFPLAEPYVQELRDSRNGEASDPPVIPVFLGNDRRWRFSWHAARRDNPAIPYPGPATPASPEHDDRAFRMQVSVPGTLANRFKATAASRGMAHTELLLTLIREAVS